MEIGKIYESLGIDKLDEAKQAEIKTFLDETIELKAKEMSLEKIDEAKEKLVTEYETKFETYKEDITSKFSNFVDDILESELGIPEKVMEYAHKGEVYDEVITLLKSKLAIDEGTLTDEIKELLKDAKEEIVSLKDKVNTLKSKEITLKEDCKKMAVDIYLRKKCDGLQESKKMKIMSLLEGIEDTEEIDRKFDIITEAKSLKKIEEEEMTCKECGAKVDVDANEEDKTCPECGGELVKGEVKAESKDKDKGNGKGKEELKESFEEKKPTTIMEAWTSILTNNRL